MAKLSGGYLKVNKDIEEIKERIQRGQKLYPDDPKILLEHLERENERLKTERVDLLREIVQWRAFASEEARATIDNILDSNRLDD